MGWVEDLVGKTDVIGAGNHRLSIPGWSSTNTCLASAP